MRYFTDWLASLLRYGYLQILWSYQNACIVSHYGYSTTFYAENTTGMTAIKYRKQFINYQKMFKILNKCGETFASANINQ